MIYLDSAATTFQKPDAVRRAVLQTMLRASSPGRGGYAQAMEAAEIVFSCREEIAQLFGVDDSERVIFTQNATHALNIAIRSLLAEGGHAVISGYEHNAVTRPLYALQRVELSVARAPLFAREETAAAFESALRSDTKAVICTHVSNVFGAVQPVEEISEICRSRQIPLIIDASQSAGTLPLRFDEWGVAFAAMPGHKGLYGPQGTGVLLCGKDVETRPLLFGGTGSFSRDKTMPEDLPDRLEAGTMNVPGIAGLREGVRFVKKLGIGRIQQHERKLLLFAAEGLSAIPRVKVFSSAKEGQQNAVLSFVAEGMPSETVAQRLAQREICVRAGLHCAPLAHESAGTLETGTVRLSFSAFNREEEVMNILKIVREITR